MILSKDYEDETNFISAIKKLSGLEPLVTVREIKKLKNQLTEVYRGERFLIHGGDCAELYENNSHLYITSQANLLFQIGFLIKKFTNRPCLHIGRIAGQYAKPRSNRFEEREGVKLKSYFGDIVNGFDFSKDSRQFDPNRMIYAYLHSKFSLSIIRKLNLCKHSILDEHFKNFLHLSYPFSCGEAPYLFCSHEALLLPYEKSLSRCLRGKYYNVSTHYPWVGVRTLSIDSPHLNYIREIHNPVAIKIGPSMTGEVLANLASIINPRNEEGRLTVITRLGTKEVSSVLPKLIDALKMSNQKVIWSCDPMHGNTKTTENGIKTRNIVDIVQELVSTFRMHGKYGSRLSGVHLEMTHENVTECVGGKRMPVTQENLLDNYKSPVDPRLNKIQALEVIEQMILELDNNFPELL